MRKGLALYIVVLLLMASWLPMANAQDSSEATFSPELGDELSAYGRGYVENLVLYSGSGVDLAWGPSFDGNVTLLDEALADLETDSGESMPDGTDLVMLPFSSVNPAFAGPAPHNHSADWTWNTSGMSTLVNTEGLGATIRAEAMIASQEGNSSLGLLMVLLATEAVMYIAENLGGNDTEFMPLNLSEPNMTDDDLSNGYWLPMWKVIGDLNTSSDPSVWDNLSIREEFLGDSALQLLEGINELLIVLDDPAIVGPGAPFANETRDITEQIFNALFMNIAGYYGDQTNTLTGDWDTAIHAMRYLVLAEIADARTGDIEGSTAANLLEGMVRDLIDIQNADGSVPEGYTLDTGGNRTVMPEPSGGIGHSAIVRALYDASARFGGFIYGAAADACFAYMDGTYWDMDHSLLVDDPEDTPLTVHTNLEAWAMLGYASAAEIGEMDLAKYRVAQLWNGILDVGLQLSETGATGENYTMVGNNDTDGDGISKHSMDRGDGKMYGVAPVLAHGASYDNGSGNWTWEVDGDIVKSDELMIAAVSLMSLDAAWFNSIGAPTISEEHANMLLHWSDAEWVAYLDARRAEVELLTEQISAVQDALDNISADMDDLVAAIDALQLDLNDSLENESLLNTSVHWLRNKLEETNGTVDNLTEEIELLEVKVERLETDILYKDENITELEVDLREARFNVTQLQWDVDNATVAMEQAEADLEAAQADADDTEERLREQEGRTFGAALMAFIAGIVVMFIIRYLMTNRD